jgi:hypothetical protein
VSAATAPNLAPPELAGASAALPATVPAPTATERAPASSVPPRAARRSASLDVGATHEHTLARQAVDALLGGDRAKALEHYQDLSRRAPENLVYREAVRLLTAAAPETNRAP